MLVKDFVKRMPTAEIDEFEYQGNNYYYYDYCKTKKVPDICANRKIIAIKFYIDAHENRCCKITFENN